MTDHYCEFPFNELRTPTGDYYSNRFEMELAGFEATQMWSQKRTTADVLHNPT